MVFNFICHKIWDLNTTPLTPKYTLMHSDSIATIKWRPKRHTQIAACTHTVAHAHLYIWDLVRPYVPYASFDRYQSNNWYIFRIIFKNIK